jgi:uncharacterized protein
MTFADLPAGTSVFVDANTFVFHFQPHPVFGPACTELLERVERQELSGFTSTHVLGEVAHRLMAIEASQRFAWPFTGIAYRLQKHPAQVRQLTEFRRAIQEVGRYGVRVLVIPADRVDAAADVSQQHGLLSNDALIVAVMQQHGLIDLASNDADFDRVPGITRYGPV